MLSDARFWTERTQDPFQPILFTQRPSGTNWLPNVLVKHPLPAKLSTTKYILTPPFYFTFSRGLLFSSGPGSAVNCDLQHHGQADSGAACGRKSDFDNPNRGMYNMCIISNAMAMSICSIFIVMRLWTRYRLSMRLQADDGMLRKICGTNETLTRQQ